MERRAIVKHINENVSLIDDAGESTCYLVTGDTHALLIDTLNGMENLKDIVSELTTLPVTVVNTHGHCDHIFGNIFFDEAYLHPADIKLHNAHFSFPMMVEQMKTLGLSPCKLLPLAENQMFDLGGIALEVIPVPGHTAGSVALLCRKHRLLFTGDAVNGHLWMQLEESLPISVLKDSLTHLLDTYRGDFDHILTGHAKGLEDAEVADALLEGATSLLQGECANDRPYKWFQSTDMAHPFGKNNQYLIAYNKTNLDIERGLKKPYPPIRHICSNPALHGLADTKLNIVYSTASGKDLTLALLTPWGAANSAVPLPLIVFVQGSGWTHPNIGYELGQLAKYASQGFAVATLTHRNCKEGNPFPAFLQDVKTAIRFLRSHAAEYNIDKDRVGIFGTSSGGNTALLVGLTGDDPVYKTAEYADESDRVGLVVECFGPTDIGRMAGGDIPPAPHDALFKALVGDQDVQQVFHDMSPINHVKAGATLPPFLLIHGDADPVVPYDQMLLMYRALYDNGADVQAICVDDAPHEGSFWSVELHDIILSFIMERL